MNIYCPPVPFLAFPLSYGLYSYFNYLKVLLYYVLYIYIKQNKTNSVNNFFLHSLFTKMWFENIF